MFPPCGPEVLAVCPAILPGRVQHWRAIYLVLRWLRLLEVQLLPWRSQNPAGNQFLVRKFLGILVVHICVAGHGNIDNSLVLSKNTINICWHSRRLTIIGFYQRRRRRTGFLYLAGFVLLEEDIQLEAEDVLALIPPRAHVPQQLSVAACFEERLMFLGGFGLVASSCVKYYAAPPC